MTNAMSGDRRIVSERWINPRQKISSAGPMMQRRSTDRSNGEEPSFMSYIRLTCGRAKLKSHCEALSPMKNTNHKTTAMMMPAMSCFQISEPETFPRQARPPNVSANVVRMQAEAVMLHQNGRCGDVQGENIRNHSTAAMVTEPIRALDGFRAGWHILVQ